MLSSQSPGPVFLLPATAAATQRQPCQPVWILSYRQSKKAYVLANHTLYLTGNNKRLKEENELRKLFSFLSHHHYARKLSKTRLKEKSMFCLLPCQLCVRKMATAMNPQRLGSTSEAIGSITLQFFHHLTVSACLFQSYQRYMAFLPDWYLWKYTKS